MNVKFSFPLQVELYNEFPDQIKLNGDRNNRPRNSDNCPC